MAATSIGARIFEARKRLDMRQRDVATALDIDAMQVSRWERDATKPSAASLEKLAGALGVSVDWLLTGREAAA